MNRAVSEADQLSNRLSKLSNPRGSQRLMGDNISYQYAEGKVGDIFGGSALA